MKTVNSNSAKKLLVAALTLFIMNGSALAQGLWQAGTSQNGNKAVVTKRDVGIGIKAPKSPLDVKGQILGDSLHIFGVARFGNTISINSPNPDDIGSDIGEIHLVGDGVLDLENIKIGIGTDAPDFSLQIVGDGTNTNGGILSEGGLGVGPTLSSLGASNPTFIWYPRKAAFRAGQAGQGNWGNAQIGDFSAAFGENTRAKGSHSFAFGDGSRAEGIASFAGGTDADAFGANSIALGQFVEADILASGNMVIGVGFNAANPLFNNISNSLMVGFNSNISTLYVGTGSGFGTTGNVGIGELATMAGGLPNNTLEINTPSATPAPGNAGISGLRFTDLNSSHSTIINPGTAGVLAVDALGNVIYVPAGIDGDWDVTTFFPDMVSGSGIVNVGIGVTAAPTNRLEINSGNSGESGLTFTLLNQGSTSAGSNTTNTVLSVDGNGKVILVDDQVGVGVGDNDWAFVTGNTINDPLWREGIVGMGTPAPNPIAKLTVVPDVVFAQRRYGIRTELPLLNQKGGFTAYYAEGEADFQNIRGDFVTFIGHNKAFSSDGDMIGGVLSRVTLRSIASNQPGFSSLGVGSVNIVELDNLNITGNADDVWIAGTYSELRGTAQNFPLPNRGAAAAVIGVDKINNPSTFAGWFEGKGYFSERVGIGITTPQNPLHIHRGGTTEVFSYFTNDHTGAGQNLGFKIGISAFGQAEFQQHHAVGGFIFSTIDPNTNNLTERVNILHDGRMGVGVAGTDIGVNYDAPGRLRLDVVGDGRFGGITNYVRLGFNGANALIDNFGAGILLMNFYSGKDVHIGTGASSANLKVGGRVGIGINPTSFFRLIINGSGFASGGIWLPSDIRYKTNIDTINNALDKITQLQGIYFDWDTINNPDLDFNAGREIGFIAQDVEPIFPEVINVDDSGYYSLEYDRLIPVLVEAIKELYSLIPDSGSVNARLDALENCINNLPPGLCGGLRMKTGNNGGGGSQQKSAGSNFVNINTIVEITPDNSLSGKETKLYQNQPNPFRYNTKFSYTIGNTGDVELIVTTYTGQYVTTLVSERQNNGSYSIDWNTTDIAPGLYFYTLKVDGMEWVKKAIRVK